MVAVGSETPDRNQEEEESDYTATDGENSADEFEDAQPLPPRSKKKQPHRPRQSHQRPGTKKYITPSTDEQRLPKQQRFKSPSQQFSQLSTRNDYLTPEITDQRTMGTTTRKQKQKAGAMEENADDTSENANVSKPKSTSNFKKEVLQLRKEKLKLDKQATKAANDLAEWKELHKEVSDKNEELESDNHTLARKVTSYAKRYKKLEAELAALKDKFSEMAGARSKEKQCYNTEIADMVAKKVKREVWRFIKFINTPEQEKTLCLKTLDKLGLKEYLLTNDPAKDAVITQKREAFADIYMGHAREALNEQRSYVQSRAKDKAIGWMKDGKDLINQRDILRVATRDIPTLEEDKEEHERLMGVFAWYWEHYLPAIAGNTYWSKAIRRTSTMTLANFKNKHCITVTTEAMAVLIYENCAQKWVAIFNWKEGGNESKKKIPKKKDDKDSAQFQGKWSDSYCGQDKYGGWHDDGLRRFLDILALVKEGRLREKAPDLEKECLELVKIQTAVAESADAAKEKASKKRKRPAIDPPVVLELGDDSDGVGEFGDDEEEEQEGLDDN